LSSDHQPWFLKVKPEEWRRAYELHRPFAAYMDSLREKYSVPQEVRLVILVPGSQS
jgi:hypothetical protein